MQMNMSHQWKLGVSTISNETSRHAVIADLNVLAKSGTDQQSSQGELE
jgi:hypothetical protein